MANETILVIDDEITSRRPCCIFLKATGYNVTEAETGEQGLDFFKKGNHELVLTDLMMPGINGIEVLKQVKAINENCGVIIMTAYAGIDTGVEAIKQGAYDYIVKPLKLDELNVKVKRCLEEQRLVAKIRELDEMVALYEISKAMFTTTGLQELLEFIVDSTLKVLYADQVSLMLFDDNGKLYIPVSRGLDKKIEEKTRLALGEGIAGQVAKNKKPVILTDETFNEPSYKNISREQRVKSALVCPLLAKNEVLGVINISRINIDKDFTQKDLHKAMVFVSQITSAIENARLFRNLQQEKEKIETMFTGMGDGAIVTDAHVNIIMINQAAELLIGLKEKDCIGKNFFNIIENFKVSPIEEINEKEKNVSIFELARKIGQPLFLSVLATKLKDEAGVTGQILILRNVTEERKEALVVRSFIAAISHKLRTPLTGIISAAELLRSKETQLSEIQAKAAEIIEGQGWEMSSLVEKLIRFSILETESMNLTMQKISLSTLLKNTLEKLAPVIKDNQVKVELSDSIDKTPQVLVDQEKMQEVFENLIENGIKFNEKTEKKIQITAHAQDAEFVRVEVADNGIGIPSEEYNKIFQRFYQIEYYFTGQVKGAGLGLAVAKKIIEAHNKGIIWVESEIGQGSKFIFVLPRA